MQIYSTSWHIISAFLVFFIGALITIKFTKILRLKLFYGFLIYLWHTFFCLFYLWYSLSNSADSRRYYSQALAGNITFDFGTSGIDYITALLVQGFGLSYLGCFLVFNIIGTIGLLYFDKSLKIATQNSSKKINLLATLIIFLPSVSFWSSAIGKDAISFLSASLALWAALELNRRTLTILFAIGLMLLVRPHMAGLMVMSLALAALFESKSSIIKRVLMGGIAVLIAASLIPFALEYAGVKDGVNTDSLMNYIEERQAHNMEGGGGIDIASMSLPMQLFAYVFRPMLFEARSIFSLSAAIDNLILLYLFIVGGRSLIKNNNQTQKVNRTFMWSYSLLSWLILSMTTANMGIALRQKWMFVPFLIFLLLSVIGQKNTVQNKNMSHLHTP